ncbi:MAG: DUF6516 family protein [Nitrospirota bacterium]
MRNYVKQLDQKIEKYQGLILSKSINIEYAEGEESGTIEGKIVFIDGSMLDFTEWFSTYKFRYRFHYMDRGKSLIARWDSSPHHKEISTFPFHLHIPFGIEESKPLRLIDVLDIVALKITEQI